jgi:hypothetical protein
MTMCILPLPSNRDELSALSDELARQADAGRAIAIALTMRDAFDMISRQAARDDDRAFAEAAADYLAGVADAIEAMNWPPETTTLH